MNDSRHGISPRVLHVDIFTIHWQLNFIHRLIQIHEDIRLLVQYDRPFRLEQQILRVSQSGHVRFLSLTRVASSRKSLVKNS